MKEVVAKQCYKYTLYKNRQNISVMKTKRVFIMSMKVKYNFLT